MNVILEHLYAALNSECGVVIQTNDAEQYLARLRTAKQRANDSDLRQIKAYPSPTAPDTEVWLVKEKQDAAPKD